VIHNKQIGLPSIIQHLPTSFIIIYHSSPTSFIIYHSFIIIIHHPPFSNTTLLHHLSSIIHTALFYHHRHSLTIRGVSLSLSLFDKENILSLHINKIQNINNINNYNHRENERMSKRRVFVIGVGMTNIVAPTTGRDYPELVREAASEALKDASISYREIQTAVVGYCYGDPTCGQRCVYELGLTGIPVFNTNNNCSTGSSALYLARNAIQADANVDCAICIGFEKMQRSLSQVYADAGWTAPTSKHWDEMFRISRENSSSSDLEILRVNEKPTHPRLNTFSDNVLKLFAAAAREHSHKYGTTPEQYARVAHKNHKQSQYNPRAMDQK